MNIPDNFTKAETFHALACFKLRGRMQSPAFLDRSSDVACSALAVLFRNADSNPEADPRMILEDCAEILAPLGAYGVECVSAPESNRHGLDYVNFGDTYDTTLCYDSSTDEFRLTSWGAWFEAAEEAHAEESDRERCGYCGEWYDPEDGTCCREKIDAPYTKFDLQLWLNKQLDHGTEACETCGKELDEHTAKVGADGEPVLVCLVFEPPPEHPGQLQLPLDTAPDAQGGPSVSKELMAYADRRIEFETAACDLLARLANTEAIWTPEYVEALAALERLREYETAYSGALHDRRAAK